MAHEGGEERPWRNPNCGTVLLTTATMATLAAQTTLALEQRRQRRPSLDLSVIANALPQPCFWSVGADCAHGR
ncbi:MAG: hypothetical protein H6661_08445 [Ardenticatenaceae bacterium]|nr:hypothetical protein [Ardenticatenaceae bacterium]